MDLFSPTIIFRHKKENLKKCSLSGLETHPHCRFFTYPKDAFPEVENYILLTPDAPPLSKKDSASGIVLIDGTWRYADVMVRMLPVGLFEKRSIPEAFKTAYPRRQEIENGLASVEALYLAHLLTGKPTEGLLDHYYWKANFLKINEDLLTMHG